MTYSVLNRELRHNCNKINCIVTLMLKCLNRSVKSDLEKNTPLHRDKKSLKSLYATAPMISRIEKPLQ